MKAHLIDSSSRLSPRPNDEPRGLPRALLIVLALPLLIAAMLDHWGVGYPQHDVTTVIGAFPSATACERLAIVATGEGMDLRSPVRKLQSEASRLGGNVVQVDSDVNTLGMAYHCGAPALAQLHADAGLH